MLTDLQLRAIKTEILADPVLSAIQRNADGYVEIAAEMGRLAAPEFWVWRTDVTRADVYHSTSPDGTQWNWTTYKNQGVPEQNAWTQMFMGDVANFALPNLRAGVGAIFTGSAQANQQRDHCLSVGRRRANRTEKLLSVGTGSAASPGTMSFEGELTGQDVDSALNMP